MVLGCEDIRSAWENGPASCRLTWEARPAPHVDHCSRHGVWLLGAHFCARTILIPFFLFADSKDLCLKVHTFLCLKKQKQTNKLK